MHIAPIIKTPPMDQVHITSPGLKVSFICTVDGGIGSLFEILWSGPVVDLPNATLVEVGSGVFTSNLTLTNVTSDFSGIYECTTRYNNSLCGTTNTSSNASLVLLGPPTLTDQTESPFKDWLQWQHCIPLRVFWTPISHWCGVHWATRW